MTIMRHKTLYLLLLLGVGSLFLTAPLMAKDTMLSAKQDGVTILASPDKTAPTVGVLKKDQTISAQERKGMYWSVTTADGSKGFVSMMQVRPAAQTGSTGLSDALRTVVQESRDNDDSNMRTRSAVMGVRGLDEQSETEFAGNVKPNLRMVYGMESLEVPEAGIQTVEQEVLQEIERRTSTPPTTTSPQLIPPASGGMPAPAESLEINR